VAGGEILGPVIALPADAATLVEQTDFEASLLQQRGAGQASDAGTDQRQVGSSLRPDGLAADAGLRRRSFEFVHNCPGQNRILCLL
jgi:hypothetical protein